MPPRVILLTQPKAGTYLISEILRRLGLHQTFYHLRLDSLDAYDRCRLDDGRRAPGHCRAEIPLEEAVKLIRCAEFAVGHLPWCERSVAAVRPLRPIFATREQRAALVSCMRFFHHTGRSPATGPTPDDHPREATIAFLRHSGPRLTQQARDALPWAAHPGVLRLRFEEVRAHPAAATAAIARHLDLPCPDPAALTSGLQTADTLTRAHTPTEIDPYWSDEAEAIFADLGGPQLNTDAGYPAAAAACA